MRSWAGLRPTPASATHSTSQGLGQVLDIVPNHMAITGAENPWWWDVLENGPVEPLRVLLRCRLGPARGRCATRMLLPILGDHYGRVLEAGELRLARQDASFTIRYHDHAFPVAPALAR